MHLFFLVTIITSVLLLLELVSFLLVNHLRKGYQWLITAKDELPVFKEEVLNKFIKHGYDPDLGWVRKPNTSGKEDGRCGQTTYHIDSKGARLNPKFGKLPTLISCYGDSFTICRQVNDDQTWEHYLSSFTKTNVLNFGVGNYGLDQAILRLKREFDANKTKIVILAVVPETISRVLNIWKHYHEYGNILGFKPRYKLDNGKIVLIKNVIDDESKFYDIKKYLEFLQTNDYFYRKKFKKDVLRFPYLFSLVKTGKRNIPLVLRLLLKQLYDLLGIKGGYKDHLHNVSVLKRNINICVQLYKQEAIVELMVKLIEDFIAFSKDKKFVPVFVLLPQLNDLVYVKEFGYYYNNFIERVKDKLLVVDTTSYLLSRDNLHEIYSNDCYGGHFSEPGNRLVASLIFKILREGNHLHFKEPPKKKEIKP